METNDKWYIRGKKGCTEQIRKEFIKRGAKFNINNFYYTNDYFIYFIVDGIVLYETLQSNAGEYIIKNWTEVKVEKPKFVLKLEPFDRVLGCNEDGPWGIDQYERYDETGKKYPYICMTCKYMHCLPYEGNEHLLGVKFKPEHVGDID